MTKEFLTAALAIAAFAAAPAQAQSGKKSSGAADFSDAPICNRVNFDNGEMICRCPANPSNRSVWGSGPYTADSDICTAALHAGAIGADGGAVRLIERPGQSSYSGSEANGVSTRDWGSYDQSYDVTAASSGMASTLEACGTIPSGVDDYACSCAANPARGSVWGNDPYTADSDICTAAVHAGYIEAGQGGDVYVLRLGGLESYHGGESNGVTTSEWNAYDSSITFDWNR